MSDDVPRSADFERARGAYNGRQRLARRITAMRREPTVAELALVDALLDRACPGRRDDPGAAQHRFVGMHAVALTQQMLASGVIDETCLIGAKIDGIGALLAFVVPPPAAAAEYDVRIAATAFLIRRDSRVDAIWPVLLPKRAGGQVLLDGELCLRKRRLSQAEEHRFARFETHYHDYDDGDVRLDDDYDLVYMACDCLVADDAATTTRSTGRLRPPVAELDCPERAKALFELVECRPTGDQAAYEAVVAAVTALGGATPLAVQIVCKQLLPGVHMRIATAAKQLVAMRGLRYDGWILNPSKGPYRPGTNMRLVKCKERADVTLDAYIVRVEPTAENRNGYGIVVRRAGADVVVSSRVWYGTHESEVDEVQRLIRLAFETAASRPDSRLVLEFRPHLPAAALVRLAEQPDLARAAREIYWQPVGTRPEKHWPNAEQVYRSTIEAFVNHVSFEALASHIEQRKARALSAE